MTDISKQDLNDSRDQIIEHINIKLEPITKEINGMKLTLYGKDGRSGVVADVNDMKTSAKGIKWLAGIGVFSGMSSWIHRIFNG